MRSSLLLLIIIIIIALTPQPHTCRAVGRGRHLPIVTLHVFLARSWKPPGLAPRRCPSDDGAAQTAQGVPPGPRVLCSGFRVCQSAFLRGSDAT